MMFPVWWNMVTVIWIVLAMSGKHCKTFFIFMYSIKPWMLIATIVSKRSRQTLIREHKYYLPFFFFSLVVLGVNELFWYLESQANFGVSGYCSQTSKNEEKGNEMNSYSIHLSMLAVFHYRKVFLSELLGDGIIMIVN